MTPEEVTDLYHEQFSANEPAKNIAVGENLKPGEAVSIDGITVIDFEALDSDMLFEAYRPKFARDSLDHQKIRALYEGLTDRRIYNFTEVIYGADKAAMEKIVDRAFEDPHIKGKFPELSLDTIQPYQAAYIASYVSAKTINYDFAVLAENPAFYEQYISQVPEPDKSKLLAMKGDPNALRNFVAQRDAELDALRADQILERGVGVCRHYAAAASAVFNTIKELQQTRTQSGSLNGTYFLYTGTTDTKLEGISDQNHAYNAFVILAHNYTHGGNEALISIADPTWGKDTYKFDQTSRRRASAAYILRVFGQDMEIEGYERKARLLAETSIRELPRPIRSTSQFNDLYNLARIAKITRQNELSYDHILGYILKNARTDEHPTIVQAVIESDLTADIVYGDSRRMLKTASAQPIYEYLRSVDVHSLNQEAIESLSHDIVTRLWFADTHQTQSMLGEQVNIDRLDTLIRILDAKPSSSPKERAVAGLAYYAAKRAFKTSQLSAESLRLMYSLRESSYKSLMKNPTTDPKELVACTYLATSSPDLRSHSKPFVETIQRMYESLRKRPFDQRRVLSAYISEFMSPDSIAVNELKEAVYKQIASMDHTEQHEAERELKGAVHYDFEKTFSVSDDALKAMVKNAGQREASVALLQAQTKILDDVEAVVHKDNSKLIAINKLVTELKKQGYLDLLDDATVKRIERIRARAISS